MLSFLIQANFASCAIALFLIVFIMTDNSFEKRVSKLFLYAIATLLGLVVTDCINYWQSASEVTTLLLLLTTAATFAFCPAVFYFTARIIRRRREYIAGLFALPLIANIFISLASCATGWVFTFDDYNNFSKGPLIALPFAVGGFYLLMMTAWTISRFGGYSRSETAIVFVTALISVGATALEVKYGFHFVLNTALIVGTTFYYLNLHVQMYKRDALTNLLNRRIFYLDAIRHERSNLAVISVDMNGLKKINDTEGHAAGDKAIITIVDTIKNCLLPGCQFYRTGGDEFMILCVEKKIRQVERIIRKIHTRLYVTPYSVSCGYALYKPGMDFEEVCSQSDAKMYEYKTAYKKAHR